MRLAKVTAEVTVRTLVAAGSRPRNERAGPGSSGAHEVRQMARAPKRRQPNYVPFEHRGTDYVVDLANREVLRNWVAIERQAMPEIVAACQQQHPEALAS